MKLVNEDLHDALQQPKLTKQLIAFLEGLILIAKTEGKYSIEDITGVQTYKFEGDFYGLLNELKVPKDLHYVTMRLNGLDNSNDYHSDSKLLMLIDLQFYDAAMSQYRTKKNI